MSVPAAVPKYIASLELLARAIELYLRGDSYYSALHLAGAAEEVLAVYVRELSTQPSPVSGSVSDQMRQAFVALSAPASPQDQRSLEKWFHDRTYAAKNSVKHRRGHRDLVIDFEPRVEAAELLELAISTYFQLFSQTELPHLACIEAFDQRRRIERAEEENSQAVKPSPDC